MGRFNIIGFFDDYTNWDPSKFRHCSIHLYRRLRVSKTDSSMLECSECGSQWPLNIKDTITEQGVQSDIPAGTDSTPKIVQPRKKKKLRDSLGNEIPADDKDAIQDMSGGKRIVYYRDDKVEQEKMDSYIVK